ncbi:unnamed protein product [Aphis gossypii]|uniref:Uncharacterized protein n=1 Tax=Aphis gossypii TaxID=80765 RepID=A0A9P0J289_APHGO|nr:unnamed protein product [Aphis gossypii]
MSCTWSAAMAVDDDGYSGECKCTCNRLQRLELTRVSENSLKFGKSVRWFVSFSTLSLAGEVRTIRLRSTWKQCGLLQDVLTTGSRVNCRYTVSRISVPHSLAKIRDTAAAAVDVICELSISHRVNAQHPVSIRGAV